MAIQTPTENWFKFPNHIADNLHTYEANDLKVLVLILRRTVGMLGLTPNPDQRFSISFIAKKCKMSENTARTVKERLLKRGDIKQDGTASDGSPLYSIVWDTPKFEVASKSEEAPLQNLKGKGVQNLDPDKDTSLKTVETKTLDASASSAAPEKMEIRNNNGGSFPPSLYCVKCGYSEPFKGEHKICPKCSNDKIKFQMLAVSEPPKKEEKIPFYEKQSQEFYTPKLDTSNMTVEFVEMKKDKIPYKEISDYFLKKHREFRKVKDEKYMPKWGAKETKAVKRLIEAMNEANLSKSEYRELTSDRIMRSFQFMTEAFILYLKDCKDSNYARTTPILPSQLTESVFNRILPYIQKLETVPKLEIKQYENKGIAIGPMPEGW